ncbi:MAG: hypothetical protein ACJATA_001101 [Sphingobacteriales bacterium]|jgi:hypothetical protein
MKNLALLLITLFPFGATAQFEFKIVNSVPVLNQTGFEYSAAWAGGLNNPQFMEIHLNSDDKMDLVVFDRNGERIIPFLNKSNESESVYEFFPDAENLFPEGRNWAVLADFNCDGLPDFFTSRASGIQVFKNIGTIGNPKFELFTNEILSFYSTSKSNLFVSAADYPAIYDIDGDGDLDVFSFEFSTQSGAMWYFKNMSVEKNGNCDSLDFELYERCWGNFRESGFDCSIVIDDTLGECTGENGAFLSPEDYKSLKTNIHAGSTTLLFDVNDDGLIDALIGDIGCSYTTLMTNDSSNKKVHMASVTPNFPTDDPAVIDIFPLAFNLDVNNDGKKDLIFTSNAVNASENFENILLYLNKPKNSVSNFERESNQFLIDQMMDFGEGSFPHLIDVNGDGNNDLLIANHGYYAEGDQVGKIAYFQNTGSNLNPTFKLINRDFANLSSLNLQSMALTSGDIDNDGDLDLFVGSRDGNIHFLKNSAGANQPLNISLATPFYFDIDVGQFSTPQLYDLNKDGLLDLIIGEQQGNINYFENSGNSEAASFPDKATVDTLGGFGAQFTNQFHSYSYPIIFDYNGDESLDMIVGTGRGYVYYLDKLTPSKTKARKLDSLLISKEERISAIPWDFNNDQKPDLIIGSYRGGLNLFENISSSILTEVSPKQYRNLLLYPNPTNGKIYLEHTEINNIQYFDIIDQLGRLVLKENNLNSNSIDLKSLRNGVYFIKITFNTGEIITRKIIKED